MTVGGRGRGAGKSLGAVIFAGLPGAGKTTVARALARRIGAVHLRIDSIEAAMRRSGFWPEGAEMGPIGYLVAAAVAGDNLPDGPVPVLLDSVNPLAITRKLYRDAARRDGYPVIEVEIVCRDRTEHRRRVEERVADIAGFRLPNWQDVLDRPYDLWPEPHLVLDTSRLSVDECVGRLAETVGHVFGEGLSS